MGSRRIKEHKETTPALDNKTNNNNHLNNKRKNNIRKVRTNANRPTNLKNLNKKRVSTKINAKGDVVKIIPLGGLEEIGKNITVIEYKNEIVLVDCGLSFPEDDMLGIDIVIPDFTYLEKNVSKIKGLFITHGHEDHIGSIPYLLKKINIPVYATPFTMELIMSKLQEHKILQQADLRTVHFGDVVEAGIMSVEFIASAHSIPDSAMLAIKTPHGYIIHTGDFKVEHTPVDGIHMDLARLGQLGNLGVLALLSDSTNSEKKGFTMSERSVEKVFDGIFENRKKRIIVAAFASNVNRVQCLVRLAKKYNRKIAVSGRSMEKVIEIARKLEYVDLKDNMFVDLDKIGSISDENLLILTTGSQGEPMAALSRMAVDEHKKIKLRENDLVIISATPIPGNEVSVSKVINTILKKGVEVIYSSLEHVHVSGHACQEEQKLIIDLVKPKYFIPVHGEIRQLFAHRNTALEMGYTKKDVPILENGTVLELTKNEWRFGDKVESGIVYVDGTGIGDVENLVLRDRQVLAQDGMIIVIVNIDEKGKPTSDPNIVSRGFIHVKESTEFLNSLKGIVKEEVLKKSTTDFNNLRMGIKNRLEKHIFKAIKRQPMILTIIIKD